MGETFRSQLAGGHPFLLSMETTNPPGGDQSSLPVLDSVLTQLAQCFLKGVMHTGEGLQGAALEQLQNLTATCMTRLTGLTAMGTEKPLDPLVQLCGVLAARYPHWDLAYARACGLNADAKRNLLRLKGKVADLRRELVQFETELDAASVRGTHQDEGIRDHPSSQKGRTWQPHSEVYETPVEDLHDEITTLHNGISAPEYGADREKLILSKPRSAQDYSNEAVADLELDRGDPDSQGPEPLLSGQAECMWKGLDLGPSSQGGLTGQSVDHERNPTFGREWNRPDPACYAQYAASQRFRVSGPPEGPPDRTPRVAQSTTRGKVYRGVYVPTEEAEKVGFKDMARGQCGPEPPFDRGNIPGYDAQESQGFRYMAGGQRGPEPPFDRGNVPVYDAQESHSDVGRLAPSQKREPRWEGGIPARPPWGNDRTDRLVPWDAQGQRSWEYGGHPTGGGRDSYAGRSSNRSHLGTKEAVSDHALMKVARSIPPFDPYGPGNKDFDTYLSDVTYYLERFAGVTMEDVIYVIRASSAREVSSFLRRQPESAVSTFPGLHAAFKREFACLTADAGLKSALNIRQGRTETPAAYYNRLRNGYFGSENYPLMEEDVNFKTIFIMNLFPALKQRLWVLADPKTWSSSALRELATKAWDSGKVIPNAVMHWPNSQDPASVFQVDAETPYQLDLEGDDPEVEDSAPSQGQLALSEIDPTQYFADAFLEIM